jgi:hypothetical protein
LSALVLPVRAELDSVVGVAGDGLDPEDQRLGHEAELADALDGD